MPSSSAHRPCTSRSSSPRFSEICAVSCMSHRVKDWFDRSCYQTKLTFLFSWPISSSVDPRKLLLKCHLAPKLWLDIFNYVKEIGVAAWRIQKEHFPDCVESVSRLSDSCWSMCTAAWGGPPWSALYCPAEKKKSKRNIKECSSDNSRNGWQLSNV